MSIAASRKQAAMWLLERLVPGTGVNNVTVAFEVAGRIDRGVFAAALRAVLARHEVLRTVFRADDATLTREVLDPGALDVPVLDIPAGDAGRDADLTAFAAEPFVMDGRPLVRAGVRAGAEGDVCCVVVHHLNFDAMSTTILLRELLVAYDTVAAGRRPDDSPVATLAERTPDERSVAYWRKNLDGLRPAEAGLWCARPPVSASSLRARTVHHELSAPARAVVRRFQRELRASEAVVLLAAYAVLLAQHGAGSDVVIGTPVNVRDQRSMTAIGYHANLVPLRVRLDPDADFRAVVKQTRSTFLEAISHADVPLEHVSPAVLADAPSSWRSSFFRHLFNYVPGTVDASLTVTGMPARHVLVENGYSRFDLEFFIMPGEDATTVRAAFCVDAFDAADVVLLLQRYDALLVQLGEALERPVARLSRRGASDLALPVPPPSTAATGSVLDAVRATVAASPELVAVQDGTATTTYGQLWSAALATRDLVAASGAGTLAVLAPRGAELAAAWLGGWLAGARCVLLDPTQPVPDLAARLAASGAGPVLAAEGFPVPGAVRIPAVPAATDATCAEAPAGPDPDAVAYLEYSLDTPAPLAVAVTHRALAGAVAQLADRVATGPAVTSWLSSSATGASLTELLLALTTGGRVVVAPDQARADGNMLGELLERHGVTVVQAPPAVWRQVTEQAGARLAGRTVLVCHEPLPHPLAAQLRATGCTPHGGYVTPGVAGYAALGGGWDGTGVLPTARVFVTEPGTSYEVGIGVRGELCVAGDALAAGYHGRPELTAARFGEHPTHGRFHRTGDLARLLPDGQVDVVGPLSAQVRLAGQRIHLADVESALATHPDVDAVAAVGSVGSTGDARVVAFVESRKPDVAQRLREHARAALSLTPELVVLNRLPVTVAGTVDRAALAVSAAAASVAAEAGAPDETTTALVAIWAELLDRPDLHADSNFFASGGHSLLGAQLVQRVRSELSQPVQLADLFGNPTPRQLAEHLRSAIWDDDEDDD